LKEEETEKKRERGRKNALYFKDKEVQGLKKNKECFRNGKLQEGLERERERDIQRNICIPLVFNFYVSCLF